MLRFTTTALLETTSVSSKRLYLLPIIASNVLLNFQVTNRSNFAQQFKIKFIEDSVNELPHTVLLSSPPWDTFELFPVRKNIESAVLSNYPCWLCRHKRKGLLPFCFYIIFLHTLSDWRIKRRSWECCVYQYHSMFLLLTHCNSQQMGTPRSKFREKCNGIHNFSRQMYPKILLAEDHATIVWLL